MKKYGILFLFIIGLLFVSSCGQTQSTPTPAPTELTTISGTVSVINAHSVGSLKPMAASGYTVVAEDLATKKLYYGTCGSDGTFSLAVPKGDSYTVHTIDDSMKYKAPVIIDGTSASSEVVMGFKASSEVTMGTITIDDATDTASVGTSMATIEDTALKARATAGIPVGAGSYGKGTSAKLPSGDPVSTGVDADRDGLPDVFDADREGKGMIDEIAGLSPIAPGSEKIEWVTCFMNLKLDYERSNTFTNSDYSIALEVVAKNGKEGDISSVVLDKGPSYISGAEVDNQLAFTLIDTDYPAATTRWSSASYKMYKMSRPSSDKTTGASFTQYLWGVWIKPKADITAGDIFRFKVTYTDGTTEYVYKMINFVFTTASYAGIPRLTTYNVGSGSQTAPTPATGCLGSFGNPITVASGTAEVSLTWTKPKDETGNYIHKMTYKADRFFYDASGVSLGESEVLIIDDTDTSVTSLTGTVEIPTTYGGKTVAKYMIGLTARCAESDNAAQNIYFKR